MSDPDQKAAKAYGLVNEKRTLPARWTFYIDDKGVVRHIDQMVNPRNHGEDVAKKLKELGVEETADSTQ